MRAFSDRPWSAVPGGVMVEVRLTPRSARDEMEGVATLADGRPVVHARVRAPATEGRANAALVRLVASGLAVAVRQVTLVAGATARIKRLKIQGDGAVLSARLERLLLPA